MDQRKTFALHRMEFFSDGVLAVIITIMALELKVPDIIGKSQLNVLFYLIPKLASYAIAFAFIGSSWINHLLVFRIIERATLKLFWLNLLFLFCASLIPFTTAFLGDHPILPFAVAMWGASAGLTACSVYLMYREVHKGRPFERWSQRQNVCSILLSVACIFTASLSVYLAWSLLFCGFSLSVIPNSIGRRIFSTKKEIAGQQITSAK